MNEMSSSIDAEFQQYQLEATLPYMSSRQVTTDWEPDFDSLLPPGCEIIRKHKMIYQTMVLARGEDLAVYIRHVPHETIQLSVCAKTFRMADDVVELLISHVPTIDPPENVLALHMWYQASHGPNAIVKKIDVPLWSEITHNYPPSTLEPLSQMMTMGPPQGTAKLILWHGDPGVGKTTALRAMAREWKSWAKMHYITDPEKVFANPSYLLEVAGTADKAEWQLVVCEDSDEFLQGYARTESGAALGRLLNFSDGILGQGTKTMILMTTNEPVSKLHPAVVRPGRCLAQVEFVKFSPDQADEWLIRNHNTSRAINDMTLAELINRVDGNKQIANGVSSEVVGTYL